MILRRSLFALMFILIIAALTGCGAAAKRNAALYTQARTADVAQTQAEALATANAAAARATAFAALAERCPPADIGCAASLADKMVLSDAIAALQAAAAPRRAQTPIPYERDLAAKSKDVLGAATPFLQSGIGAYVTKVQSDNSTRVQLGEQGMVSSIVAGATSTARDVAVAAVENAQPNVSVGGDYVTGTQHTGDAITGDGNATRGGQNGDTQTGDGNAAGGSQIGHSVESGALVDGSTNVQIEQGPGDQLSPPTTISNDGNECEGEGCQPTEPAEPEPDDPPPEATQPVPDPGT